MSFCGYKYKFGLYASHSNVVDSDSSAHFHNFTITLYIKTNHNKSDENFEVEREVRDWLKVYQGKQLSHTELFTGKQTTLEGMGSTFYDPLYILIENLGYRLIKLDIYENPIRIYSVSDKLLDNTVNEINSIPLECIPLIQIDNPENIISNEDNSNLEIPENEEVENVGIIKLQNTKLDTTEFDTKELESAEGYIPEETGVLDAYEEVAAALEPKNISFLKRYSKFFTLLRIFFGVGCLFSLAALTSYIVQISGKYPQGSDTFCHLYRADLILNNISQGNWYPLYDSNWYNGVEIMRYWGPVPLYLIAGIEWLTQTGVLDAYVLFLGVLILIGGSGWLLWGIRYKRIELSIILGLIWFYMPENIRVVIFEGNLPRGVINALLPFFFYFFWRMIEDRKKNAMWPFILVTALITLCHLGITIMLMVTIAIITAIYSKMNHSKKWSLCAFGSGLAGVMIAGVWVVPALIGGAASGSSTNQVMKNFFESATVSLNPYNRLSGDGFSFYFGLSVFIICVIGLIFGTKKVKPGFITAIILFLCTTKSVYTLFAKLPFSQFLWMIRFIPIGLAAAMVSFILWKQLKKWMVIMLCIALIADCATSIQYLYYPGTQDSQDVQAQLDLKAENLLISEAKEITNQRLALMDLSKYGSFSPYYISSVGKKVQFTFGAGWEGASTASNIVNLNGAIENGWYSYLFDRALELGNDTLLIPINNLKNKSRDVEEVVATAKLIGYNLIQNNGNSLLFHKETFSQFGIITKYKNIAIGDSASGIAMIFPDFKEESDSNINNYTFEELSQYHRIYLSGITYDNKVKAEELLLKLAESGVQVYIDMNRVPEDKAKKRMEMFGVNAQTITFTETYPDFQYNGKTYKSLDFTSDIEQWNTVYLDGLEIADGICEMTEKSIPYIGTSKNKNLHFIGLNVIYYLQTTKDSEINKLVNTIFDSENHILPSRDVVPISINISKNQIEISSEYDNVNTTLSNIDIFSSDDNYMIQNNLVVVNSGLTVLHINYPHLVGGIIVTVVGISLAVLIYAFMRKIKESVENEKTKEEKN